MPENHLYDQKHQFTELHSRPFLKTLSKTITHQIIKHIIFYAIIIIIIQFTQHRFHSFRRAGRIISYAEKQVLTRNMIWSRICCHQIQWLRVVCSRLVR